MVDREPNFIEPFLLTPEHWDGHAPVDDCAVRQTDNTREPSLRQRIKVDRFAKAILTDFLATSGQHPVRTFGKDEEFLPDQFPEGTVVEFTKENLRLGDNYPLHKSPEHSLERILGVVYGYEGKTGRETGIIGFSSDHIETMKTLGVTPMYGAIGTYYSLPIKIGEVTHRKERTRKERDHLERLNQINVLQMGKGIPEKARRKLDLPSFNVIFRPQPGHN